MRGQAKSINEADLARVEKSFEVLNVLLNGKEFAAGDNLTIADFTISTSICMTLVSLSLLRRMTSLYRVATRKYTLRSISRLQCFDFDISRYDNVAAYYDRCKENLERFGFDEVHAMGVKVFTEMYHANLQESN